MQRGGSRDERITRNFHRQSALLCGILLLTATATQAQTTTHSLTGTAAGLAALDPQQKGGERREWLTLARVGGQQAELKVRVNPLVSGFAATLRHWGVAAQEVHQGRKSVALSAALHIGRNLPDLRLHIGKRAAEPFGAFYASHKGLRWAAVWPVDRFTLRVEGGKDSEFGYVAIAGVHWRHPERPIAIGIGIPARMKRTEGEFAAIAQLRLQFGSAAAWR